ncbi:Fe-S cluster assembly protein SufD [Vibrio caribbeanicus]|uniref:Fe-S cluster assembly protein SufD n=1 Tax=Vibrio caribbeanicus TaxID=701175 RepID=UPI0022840C9D|nr:Fe-S cluster assembly protein SufD [Vibrio caribbeanicus]MCY9845186.1 Fe-S cluster assembly protein SufD [Vibrio caribbeanicus]
MAGLLKENKSIASDWFMPKPNMISEYAERHWDLAKQVGFPTPKHEDWKYTSLTDFRDIDFSHQGETIPTQADIDKLAIDAETSRIVFVNGRFISELSDIDDPHYRLTLLDENAKQRLPKPINPEFFLHMTEASARETLHIEVAKNCVVSKPIYLLNIVSRPYGGMSQQKIHVTQGQGSQVKIIEHLICDNLQDTSAHYSGSRLVMDVADNAGLDHYKLCFASDTHFHFGHNDIFIGRDAKVASHTFLFSGQLTRHHTSSQLNGENSHIDINSLTLPRKSQTYDSRTYLEHNKGHCTSRQIHKVIASESSKAVFNGMIKVAPNALKTDGQMDNHNLLLSRESEVNSKPQLEIYADDVKCSHGTTTGALNKEQVFYLQTRGLAKEQAEQLITLAFAAEVAEEVDIPFIRQLALESIKQKMSKVSG